MTMKWFVKWLIRQFLPEYRLAKKSPKKMKLVVPEQESPAGFNPGPPPSGLLPPAYPEIKK